MSKAANFDARPARPERANTRLPLATAPANLLREADTSVQDIRMDKVEALRRAIAEGRYDVSARQIAVAMIHDGLF